MKILTLNKIMHLKNLGGYERNLITMNRLEGKVAIVTGANSGIGAATAELFAKEGASVVIVDLMKDNFNEVADRIIANGGKAMAIPGDVASLEDCIKVFNETIRRFGKVDILVNNAGIGDYTIPTIRLTDVAWEKSIAVNQTGPFHFCREALKYMTEANYGVIVNVASVAGVYGNAGAAYSATKHAVVGLTKNIAIQYAGKGIRCNAVCPGATLTSMLNPENEKKFDQEMWATVQKHQCEDIPLIDAFDQANAILFFASDESKSVTGQIMVVDNGRFL
ncbi:MAG: Dehydrogenase with different specificity (related to short-chain alcohol dehydrogenase) [Firmicutes bacterium]|nr:Dehydrogenase with different specificity (related to short-chain alcohol dehydrogenase) [Bacillota bacterium]